MNLLIGITKNDVITKKPYAYIYEDDGIMNLWYSDDLDFTGTSHTRLFTRSSEKINFAIASAKGDDELDIVKDTIKEIFPYFKDFHSHDETCPAYKDEEGNDYAKEELILNPLTGIYLTPDGKNTTFNPELEYYRMYTGRVRDEDNDLLKNFLKEQNISLKEFILNKKYIVIMDVDNELAFYIKHNIITDIVSVYDNQGRTFTI